MGRFRLVPVILAFAVFLTACTQQGTSGGQSAPSGMVGSGPDGETAENPSEGRQDIFVDASNRDILEAYAGTVISQTIAGSGGRTITVEAEVDVDGITRVSRYKYIPQPCTEEFRKALFRKMHLAESWDVNDAAEYDAENDLWEFVTPRGEAWSYQVFDSGDYGEQVFNHERTDVSLDGAEDGSVYPVRLSGETGDMLTLMIELADSVPGEIETIGGEIIGSVAQEGSYSCSYLHICGKDGGHPYVKAVYKQVCDGMPVTTWHNFSTATAEGGPFPIRVWGSFFSTEELGLEQPILSAKDAVTALGEQVDSLPVQEETQLLVTRISLEYLSVLSAEGEPEIVPVWRFWLGQDEEERILMCEDILAVDAISGEVVWENRGVFT